MNDEGAPAPPVSWNRRDHGVNGIPPCRRCGAPMDRSGGRYGLQMWSDHWTCANCGWELRLSYGRGSV